VDPIENVAAAKGKWAKFDKALEGVSAERKADIQRLISNLGLTPDDPAVIAAALLGHLAKAGEEVPASIRQAGSDASESFNETSRHSLQGLREVVATLAKITPSLRNKIAEDIREEAHSVLRETLDKLAEGSERAIAQAQETAMASAKKQFAEQSAKLLSGIDERLATKETLAFWKGVAYALMGASAIFIACSLYFLMAWGPR
jgi:DNA anti-recombination protein RmuC